MKHSLDTVEYAQFLPDFETRCADWHVRFPHQDLFIGRALAFRVILALPHNFILEEEDHARRKKQLLIYPSAPKVTQPALLKVREYLADVHGLSNTAFGRGCEFVM